MQNPGIYIHKLTKTPKIDFLNLKKSNTETCTHLQQINNF